MATVAKLQFLLLCAILNTCWGKQLASDPILQKLPSDGTVYVDCGGVMTDSIGSIAYKQEEPLAPNERCVWVIRPSNVSHYEVSVYSMGFPAESNDTRLIILGIGTDPEEEKAHIVPRERGIFTFDNRQVLIVTFYTGENITEETTGFHLQYAGTQGFGTHLGLGSKNFFKYTSTVSSMHFPDHRGNYTNNEISTIMFYSNGVKKAGEEIQIEYSAGGLQADCRDSLNVYRLYPTRALLESNRICDRVSSSYMRHTDLTFLVFKSDDSITDSGFALAWIKLYDRCLEV